MKSPLQETVAGGGPSPCCKSSCLIWRPKAGLMQPSFPAFPVSISLCCHGPGNSGGPVQNTPHCYPTQGTRGQGYLSPNAHQCWRRSSRGCDRWLTYKLDLGPLPLLPVLRLCTLPASATVGAVFKDSALREECVAETI